MHVTLSAGPYEATIVSEGAGLASLRRHGRNLVLSHQPDETPPGYMGKVLVPWPNRVAGGTYVFDGERRALEVNDVQSSAALHGLVAYSDWDLISSTESGCDLAVEILPTEGYPHRLRTIASYRLDEISGLTLRIRTANVGDSTAPYGVGTHSYLTCDGAPIDSCELLVPAKRVLRVDAELTPVGECDATELGLDFTQERALKVSQIDHAFTSMVRDPDGQWIVKLRDPETSMSVELASDERWLQIYSGENLDRLGLGVEPMTCPPNAFNSGRDLILLRPGQSTEHTIRIYEGG